jgi:iron complex outermembrane recepter protein
MSFHLGCISAIVALIGTLVAVNADARTSTQRFDLPNQSLQNALIEFGLQAKVTLLVDQNLIQGQKMTVVTGDYPIDQALSKLLSQTDLEFTWLPKATAYLLIKRKKVIEEPSDLTVEPVQNEKTIEEINVVGRLYYPLRYNTVTNTQLLAGVSYFDSARFLNVIPRTLIEDQQANDMFDAIKYASGITSSDGLNDSNDDFYIRGFKRHSIYLDGFRLGDSIGSKMLPANIERVEIIKGPSTLFYGQAEPGGVINFVRKRAETKSFGDLEVGVGSFGKKMFKMDLNNPVQLSEQLDYRLIGFTENKDSESEIENIERQLLSASATYHLTSNTDLSIHYDLEHSTQTDPKNFLVARPFVDLDGDAFEGATLADGIRTKRAGFTSDLIVFSTELSHYFSSDWRILVKYDWLDEDRVGVRSDTETLLNTNGLINPQLNFDTFFVFGAELLVPIDIISNSSGNFYRIGQIRSLYDEAGFENAEKISLSFEGSLETGILLHHLSMGTDWQQQNLYKGYLIEERLPGEIRLFAENELEFYLGNIFNDVFRLDRSLGQISVQEMRLLYDDYGIFFQDSIELTDQWILNAGTRRVIMQGDYTDLTLSQSSELQNYDHWSSQFGLVYQHSDQYSWFGNYSEALKSNYHLDDVGPAQIDPELSYQFELGVKSLLNNGRFLSSLAIFQINKDNVVDHVLDQGLRTSLGLYSMRAMGIDADFTWQLNSRWDLMGAVSIQSSDILDGPYAGTRVNMTADQIASLFAHYQFTPRFAFNLGLNYVGDRESQNRLVSTASRIEEAANDYRMSAYANLDFSAVYDFSVRALKTAKVKLLIKNLTNTEYYTATTPGVRENYAEGRFFQLSIEAGI